MSGNNRWSVTDLINVNSRDKINYYLNREISCNEKRDFIKRN